MAAATLRPGGGGSELLGDGVVGSLRCRRPMPRPSVRVRTGPGGTESRGECGVGGPPLGGGGCLGDRRADEWVTHLDEVAVDPQQARALHLAEGVPAGPHRLAGAAQLGEVERVVRRRQQHQRLRRRRRADGNGRGRSAPSAR